PPAASSRRGRLRAVPRPYPGRAPLCRWPGSMGRGAFGGEGGFWLGCSFGLTPKNRKVKAAGILAEPVLRARDPLRLAPPRSASLRLAPPRSASLRLAPPRSASLRLAPPRSASLRLAPPRSASLRLAPPRSASLRLAPPRSA